MNKLQIVTDKICELLKGTELDPNSIKNWCGIKIHYCGAATVTGLVYNYTSEDGMFNISASSLNWRVSDVNECDIVGSPIREAEVLMALKDLRSEYNEELYMTLFGIETHDLGIMCAWMLGKSLEQQYPETIEFLFTVLNCES